MIIRSKCKSCLGLGKVPDPRHGLPKWHPAYKLVKRICKECEGRGTIVVSDIKIKKN